MVSLHFSPHLARLLLALDIPASSAMMEGRPRRERRAPVRRFSMAVIQLSSTQDPEENLQEIGAFVREAGERGAQAAALPECALYRGLEMERYAQDVPGGAAVRRLAQLARETGLWLHCGSLYERAPQGGRPYNCTLVIRPDGTLAGKYRKLHPFDVAVPNGPAVRESDQIRPGEEIVTVDAGDLGTWGLSICYDLRFGELYRLMALEGAQVLFVPANFTLNTGRDHWEVLVRARAIENQTFLALCNSAASDTACAGQRTRTSCCGIRRGYFGQQARVQCIAE